MEDLRQRIEKGERELQKLDPIMGKLITRHGTIIREPRTDYFMSLSRGIIGQQLSVKAASTIFSRFEALTGLDPQRVVAATHDELRSVGLSNAKANYIQDLAQHFATDPAVYNHLDALTDEEVIAELIAVKGIGIWTAQMFLIFTLVRLDVFAPDDVGLQNAMRRLYGWDTLPPKTELLVKSEVWRPYRTIASWHLWHSLDNEPKLPGRMAL
jgi:DNA-3-methyladenine glycosylase II